MADDLRKSGASKSVSRTSAAGHSAVAEQLRALKEEASKLAERGKHRRAAELFDTIASYDPDPIWLHRAGESLRRSGALLAALPRFERAAAGYAQRELLLKAISVCKMILEISPEHQATQTLLVDLYAKKDGPRAGESPSGGAPATTIDWRIPPPPETPAAATTATGEASAAEAAPPFAAHATPETASSLAPSPVAGQVDPAAASPTPPTSSGEASPRLATPPAVGEPLPAVLAIAGATTPVASAPARSLLSRAASLLGLAGPRRAPRESWVAIDTPLPTPFVLSELMEGAAPVDEEEGLEVEMPAEAELAAMVDAAAASVAVVPTPKRQHIATPVLLQGILPGVRASQQFPALYVPLDDDHDSAATVAANTLPNVPLFSSLDPPHLRRLIDRVKRVTASPGEVIVRQGDSGESLYVIVQGTVEVMARAGGEERCLGTLTDGEFFGEMAVVTDFRRSATVRATSEVELLAIDRATVRDLVADAPEVLRVLLRFFRDRIVDRLVMLSPLFGSLAKPDAAQLSARFQFLEFEAGQPLLQRGQRAEALFVILCGACDVLGLRGEELVPIAVMGPGDLCGAVSLLQRAPESVTVRTRTTVWALALPRQTFHEVILTHPQVLIYVSEVADELRQRMERVGLF